MSIHSYRLLLRETIWEKKQQHTNLSLLKDEGLIQM